MSKSLGNGVDPEVVVNGGSNKKKEPAYGADVLRWWVASSDFTGDVHIGPNALAIAAESVRRIRNCARFMLGNLHGFEKGCVSLNQLTEVDKFALNVGTRFLERVDDAMQQLNFVKATQEIMAFVNTDMSSFYFEMLKDRLYLEKESSLARRSAQAALWQLSQILIRAIAPMTPHLAEEIFHFRAGRDPASVQDSVQDSDVQCVLDELSDRHFEELRQLHDVKLEIAWHDIRLIRKEVFRAVQQAQDAGIIKTPQEASISIYSAEEVFALLSEKCVHDANGDTLLATVLNCSECHIDTWVNGPQKPHCDGGTIVSFPEDMDNLCIAVKRTTQSKCPRCWRFVSAEPEKLCLRCERVLSGEDELR